MTPEILVNRSIVAAIKGAIEISRESDNAYYHEGGVIGLALAEKWIMEGGSACPRKSLSTDCLQVTVYVDKIVFGQSNSVSLPLGSRIVRRSPTLILIFDESPSPRVLLALRREGVYRERQAWRRGQKKELPYSLERAERIGMSAHRLLLVRLNDQYKNKRVANIHVPPPTDEGRCNRADCEILFDDGSRLVIGQRVTCCCRNTLTFNGL